MLNNDFFCNRQSKSRAARIGRTGIVQPVKLFKYGSELIFADASGVLENDGHHIPGDARRNVNDAVVLAVCSGVFQNVIKAYRDRRLRSNPRKHG